MVFCGVFVRGAVGPKTAMLLGQKIRVRFCSRAISRMWYRLFMFTFQASCGFCSPVADNSAAR